MVDQKVTTFEKLILQRLRPKPKLGMVKTLTFLSDRWIMLNFGPSHRAYFSLRNDSLWTKIGVKTDEISPKYRKT